MTREETQKPNTEVFEPLINADDDVLDRFEECAHLLNWNQWNHIFAYVEGLSDKERKEQPEKYTRA